MASGRLFCAPLLGAAGLVALVVAACTGGGHPQRSQSARHSVPAASSSPVVEPPRPPGNPVAAHELYYAVRQSHHHGDLPIYERPLDARDVSGRLQGRGTGEWPTAAPAPGAAGTIRWYSPTSGRVTLASPGQSHAAFQEGRLSTGGDPAVSRCALNLAGTYYVQRRNVVLAMTGSRIVARYHLPLLPPDQRYKNVTTGHVAALVPTSSGHVLAFGYGWSGPEVTDLMTQRTVNIPGYQRIDAAVRTASGVLLVVVDNAFYRDGPLRVLRLDPHTLRIVSTFDAGRVIPGLLDTTLLPGLGHDAVLAFSDGTPGGSLFGIWTIDGNAATKMLALNNREGVLIAPADTHDVYVYGGESRHVGELDVVTGAFTADVPELDPPAGSVVVAII